MRERLNIRLIGFLILLVAVVTAGSYFLPRQSFLGRSAPREYYVDCKAGSDKNKGSSPELAWRSLSKANKASLAPGDSLFLKRGCVWKEPLVASWNGTSRRTILIGAYGSGDLPRIENASGELEDRYHINVDVTGSYQLIENIETGIENPPTDPGCKNNPVGFFAGFNLRNPNNRPNGGSYNVLQNVKASGHTVGVHLSTDTHNNRVLRSTFTDNSVMSVLTPKNKKSTDDIGAWGVLLRGSDHEIAYNYFARNHAICTYDTAPQGNAIELFEAKNNRIHHNVSVDDRVFSELGRTQGKSTENNVYAYNLVVSSVRDAHFIITRGTGIGFGPTIKTFLYNNTVYYTGPDSEGIICGAGCSKEILTAVNNIIWAEKKAAFADGPFGERNNIYWSSDGSPLVQFEGFRLDVRSMRSNPRFVDPEKGNFHLSTTSPAIEMGTASNWRMDLDCKPIPDGGNFDIGAFEFREAAAPQVNAKASPLSAPSGLPDLLKCR